MSSAALQLTQPAEPGFDHRQWEWSIRDSGLLARFKPADSKLVILAKCVANKHGEFDLSVSWAAEVLGMTRKGTRGGINRLKALGLMESAGKSQKNRQIERYRLIYPPVTGPTVAAEKGADSIGGKPQVEPVGTQGGTRGSLRWERPFPQSERKAKDKAAQGPPPPIAPLFQAKAYDAEATAKLVGMGFDKRRAHGLVTQYRPTAAEIGNVTANIAAKNAEAGDNRRRRVQNPQAFVIGAMKRADYALDDRVLTQRRKSEQKCQHADKQASQANDRAAADARYWHALTESEHVESERIAREKLPPRDQDNPGAVHAAALYRAREMGYGDWKGTEATR